MNLIVWILKKNFILEFLKSLIIKNFDVFLTGSEKHKDYLKNFISKKDKVIFSTGYDVVDYDDFKNTKFKYIKKLYNKTSIILFRLEEIRIIQTNRVI